MPELLRLDEIGGSKVRLKCSLSRGGAVGACCSILFSGNCSNDFSKLVWHEKCKPAKRN